MTIRLDQSLAALIDGAVDAKWIEAAETRPWPPVPKPGPNTMCHSRAGCGEAMELGQSEKAEIELLEERVKIGVLEEKAIRASAAACWGGG